MDERRYRPIEELDVFLIFEGVATVVWSTVAAWPQFAKTTVGEQLVTSADSVGANLVEGDGRGSDPDAIRFFRYARASAREARLWIRRSIQRKLIEERVGENLIAEMEKGALLLNNLIKYRRERKSTSQISESLGQYDVGPLEAVE